MLGGNLLLLHLDQFALGTLEGSILAHEPHTTVHLRKVLGGENKHQLVLNLTMTGHIAQTLEILLLALLQLRLQRGQLRFQQSDVSFDMCDIFLDIVDIFLTFINLAIDDQQIIESFLYIRPIGPKQLFLLLDFLLDSCPLVLKAFDFGIRIDWGFLGGLRGFSGFAGLYGFAGSSGFSGSFRSSGFSSCFSGSFYGCLFSRRTL